MSPAQESFDQLYIEEVLQAKRQTPIERFRGTFEMTELALSMMRSGVRHQFPKATEDELLAHGRERLARIRQVQDQGVFVDAGR